MPNGVVFPIGMFLLNIWVLFVWNMFGDFDDLNVFMKLAFLFGPLGKKCNVFFSC